MLIFRFVLGADTSIITFVKNPDSSDKKPSVFRRFYNWFVKWGEKPEAEKALAGFSFIEAIIFPIPPDPLLMAMVFNKPNRFVRYATITAVFSIVGGIIGYFFGWALFESVGSWIIDTFSLHEAYVSLGASFQNNGFIAVLAAAMTPIPYKIITISAGAFKVNFLSFILASIIGRSLRFFGVSYLAKFLGVKYKQSIERYIDAISVVLIVLLIIVVVLFN